MTCASSGRSSVDLPAVITHLKTYVPLLQGRVAGIAEFAATMAGELRPEAYPAAYCVPLGEDAEPNDESNALYQLVTERLGVVVEFDNQADRRGQGVTLLYAPMRAALYAALLNWRDTDPMHSLRGFEASTAGLLQSDRARIFYQWEFTLPTVVTDADGWHPTAEPLLEILANADPLQPKPAFSVFLPQP